MHLRDWRNMRALTAVLALTGAASCGDVARQGRSPAFLVIDSLQAASGADPESLGGTLQSDVITLVGAADSQVPTVFEDVGEVRLRILLKDQGVPGTPNLPSALNAITVNRYRITFRRSDGRNTPGVDVPFPFDGAVTATITDTPVTLGFTFVRAQAKAEAPLRSLAGGGGRVVISTIADVTFYGRDQAGNEVQQVGSISVNFADWADPA